MVLFGITSGTKDRGRGTFNCPQCKSDQRYVHIELVRKGHLYFVPLIELGTVGEYVECQNCGGQFDVAVLTLPTRASVEQSWNVAIRGALAVMIRADAVVDDRETTAARHIIKKLTGEELGVGSDTDIESVDLGDLNAVLSELSEHISEIGKVQILKACVIVAAADGTIDSAELDVLNSFADVLGVPTQYVPGIIEASLGPSTD